MKQTNGLNGVGRLWQLYKMGGITPAIASVFDARTAQQMAFIRSIMKEQRKNKLYDMPLDSLEVVVFDLETTGFSPYNGDEIISIGAVTVRGDRICEEESFYSLVNPKREVPREIEELTGLTNEMVRRAPDLIEVLHNFLQYVRHRVLVAHGSGHDKHFLNSALWRTSKINLTHRLIDCMLIAKWLEPKRKHYGLDSLLESYGIEVSQRHHALEDSIMTAKLWIKMIRQARERDIPTLGDLYAHLSRYSS
ncbi:exonuclease domain-containing protein [Paenibacillus thermoaerophilus]|jgi:DNA polymerase-3 subunit epsilon|uniref:Exonuclease domain-containing protein n=1 Tax=Paenibacillus thermoaerophilus TaxID=1215385 RepID=A0ABW2V5E9_9BACL|nr:exonuclease domain-containing protein [Paenibacillus thermoaerophilus]TMV17838.1 3'-5' exonuclease [Paenibacillus thermoaerophilus]